MDADRLRAAMAPLFAADQRRRRGGKATKVAPEVAIVRGRVIAWAGTKPRTRYLAHNTPDLEVVLLAQAINGIAVLDDRKAIRAAADLGVKTATTREVIAEMIRRGLIAGELERYVEKLRSAEYHPTSRTTGAWDGS